LGSFAQDLSLQMFAGALDDLLVLDLSEGVAGPYCAKLFADYGARVVKLERPGTGDPARLLAPRSDHARRGEGSGIFAYLSARKQSATLDLGTPEGPALLRRLVAVADVLIESSTPGTLEALGLGAAQLHAIRPDLVLSSVTWFGQSGPYRHFAGSDGIAFALAGVVQGIGTPEGPPLLPSGYQAQLVAGTTAFIATLGALHGRFTGQGGRRVDQSILESVLCFTETGAVAAYPAGAAQRQRRLGINRFVPTFPCGIYRCRDGWVGVTALTPAQWKAFCALAELPELDAPRYETSLQRLALADELEQAFVPRLLERSADEWLERGQAARIPFARVPTMAELLELPQYAQRQAFVTLESAELGPIRVPASPFRLLRTPAAAPGAVPALGEHTALVYAELLGLHPADLVKLRAEGAI
jgi:crotonobetainyl-CoA:carnitine CoA-transferase CaiB-like acyl-CoA transferase